MVYNLMQFRYRRAIPFFTIKEMKAALVLNTTIWFLLGVKLGESITCIKCGLEGGNASCEREVVTIDCSSHTEFGEEFDSCFSMTAYPDNKRTQIKDCAMHSGCEELEHVLCKHYKPAGNSTEKSCRVECCRDDLCNGGSSRFAAMINASRGYDAIMFWIFVAVFLTIELILP